MTKSRKIRVDFFRESGKWYSGGEVKVNHLLFEDEFKQDIVDNQEILHDGWQGSYIVVTDDVEDDGLFSKAVFLPSQFKYLRKNQS